MRRAKILLILIVLSAIPASHAGERMAVIRTPNPCVSLERVDGQKVYLKSSKNPCARTEGRLAVRIPESAEELEVYLDGELLGVQRPEVFDLSSVENAVKKAEGLSKEIKIPENLYREAGEQKAYQGFSFINSPAFQKRIEDEKERIKNELFGSTLREYYADREKQKGSSFLSESERVYIFVSSSVPIDTLRSYAADIDRLGDPGVLMVMRGFVGGMRYVRPTAEFVGKILVKDPSCSPFERECDMFNVQVRIDPFLFRRYGIERVPAVVYVRGLKVSDPQLSEGLEKNAPSESYHIVYGDTSLKYALEIIHREKHISSLKRISDRL